MIHSSQATIFLPEWPKECLTDAQWEISFVPDVKVKEQMCVELL